MSNKQKSGVRLVWDSKNSNDNTSHPMPGVKAELVFPNPIYDNNIIFNKFQREKTGISKDTQRLIQGNNLDIIQMLLKNGYQNKIDLIYIDPPYLSESNYRSKISTGKDNLQKPVERLAFKDKWDRGIDSYLDMIYPRLKLMKELLSDNGSIFVHVDWHVSHYVKILLDELFSVDNFINEIVWCYGGGTGTKRHFHRKHDIILWYVNGKNYIFNPQYRPYSKGTIQRGLTRVKGDKYRLNDKGALMQDWWTDINKILSPTARENLKFPTQKPLALLKRIVAAASNPGSIVADFFAGSGTMAEACNELGRKWIMVDNSNLAIQTSIYRLINSTTVPFTVEKLKTEDNSSKLILEKPVVEKFDDESNLLKISIKKYDPAVTGYVDDEFSSYIEFWAVDLNYSGTFYSDYQIMRKKSRFKGNLPLDLVIKVPRQNNYCIAVKTYDIFGQTNLKILEFGG